MSRQTYALLDDESYCHMVVRQIELLVEGACGKFVISKQDMDEELRCHNFELTPYWMNKHSE